MLDPGQIQQVLINLLTNAADAMKEHRSGRPMAIEITTRHIVQKKQIEILVRDTGPGVPEELRNRIFEPNFTTKENGHGFGLSTSYRIMENHGGRIAVSNHEQGGAVFTMTLPVKKPKTLAKAA